MKPMVNNYLIPYLKNLINKPKLINEYIKVYFDVSNGCRDFYKWFYKLALNICCENGVLAYITPDTFLNMPKYKDLRMQLFKHKIGLFADLGFSIFNAPTVSSAISIIQKDNSNSTFAAIADIRSFLSQKNRTDIRMLISEHKRLVEVINNELCAYKHHIAEKIYNSLDYHDICNYVAFIEGEHDIQIDKSILTYNKQNGYLPVLIDSEMRRNGFVGIGYIPSLYCAKNNLHQGARALLRKTGDTICVSLPRSEEFAVAHQNVYIIKDKIGYSMLFWMGLLNSKLLSFLYQNGLYGQKGRTMAQFRIYALNVLPFPQNTDIKAIKNIENLVSILVNNNESTERKCIESQIDKIVYDIYGLTDAEIRTIEESV